MEPERAPLGKVFNVPFLSLDGTSVEMATLLILFLLVIAISQVKRHRPWIRRVVQLLSFLVFYGVVYSCLGVFGMIRNGLYGLTLLGSAYSESFYWLALPVVILSVTLLHGPVFCGWICPTGSMQDLSGFIRKRIHVRLRSLSRFKLLLLALISLGFIAFLIWVGIRKQLFVEDSSLHWSAMLILLCYLLLVGIIEDRPTRRLRLFSLAAIFFTAVSHMVVTSPVHFAFTARDDPASAITTLIILVAGLVVARSWCRYLCPWGYLMGFFHRFSRLHILQVPNRCHACGRCDAVCDVAAIEKGKIELTHCQFCYACVDQCPENGLQVVDVWQTRRASKPGLAKPCSPPEKPVCHP